MEAYRVNQTRRFHFQWFQRDPTTNSRSKFVANEKNPFFGHDWQISAQNKSPRVQPILVGPFLFDRYWMDLGVRKTGEF
ncbi:MAG: hypothetical protein GY820_21400 [Gammaproteobacteria bacterium]|nr:hypothetical protein [Gammaproteobacteria bacterium]